MVKIIFIASVNHTFGLFTCESLAVIFHSEHIKKKKITVEII